MKALTVIGFSACAATGPTGMGAGGLLFARRKVRRGAGAGQFVGNAACSASISADRPRPACPVLKRQSIQSHHIGSQFSCFLEQRHDHMDRGCGGKGGPGVSRRSPPGGKAEATRRITPVQPMPQWSSEELAFSWRAATTHLAILRPSGRSSRQSARRCRRGVSCPCTSAPHPADGKRTWCPGGDRRKPPARAGRCQSRRPAVTPASVYQAGRLVLESEASG